MEANREPEFLPHDGPLREDVGRLGAMVGHMLAEQGGTAFFERSRAGAHGGDPAPARRCRGGRPGRFAGRPGCCRGRSAGARVRHLFPGGQHRRAGPSHPPPPRLPARRPRAAAGIAARRADPAQGARRGRRRVARLARQLWIEPVFTAHPTEAVRRSLLEKEQAIVRSLVDNFDPDRTPQERKEDDDRIFMALSSGWQTAEASPVRPTVQDEHHHVGFYLANPLYRIVPALYESLAEALQSVYGIAAGAAAPAWLRHLGRRRHGRQPERRRRHHRGQPGHAARARARALPADVAGLARLLSQTEGRVAVDPQLHDAAGRLPRAAFPPPREWCGRAMPTCRTAACSRLIGARLRGHPRRRPRGRLYLGRPNWSTTSS